MKYLKKFEIFNFSQTLPIASKNSLTTYYSCDECDNLWKEINNVTEECKECGSKEIEELSEDEWYEVVKSRSGEEDIEELDKERQTGDEEYFDLVDLTKKDDEYYVN